MKTRERMCIVTREVKPEDKLLRFASDMDGVIVPDLRARLPGRGVWVTLDRATIEIAFSKRHLHRGLEISKSSGQETSDFINLVSERLDQATLGALGLARRAGDLITGFEKVMKELGRDNIMFLIHASDAAKDGMSKIASRARAMGEGELPYIETGFSNETLSAVLGHPNVMHAAVLKKGSGKTTFKAIKRRNQFYAIQEANVANNTLTLDAERRNRRYMTNSADEAGQGTHIL